MVKKRSCPSTHLNKLLLATAKCRAARGKKINTQFGENVLKITQQKTKTKQNLHTAYSYEVSTRKSNQKGKWGH